MYTITKTDIPIRQTNDYTGHVASQLHAPDSKTVKKKQGNGQGRGKVVNVDQYGQNVKYELLLAG